MSSNTPTGILIVHGIGNQKEGELRDSVAERLTDTARAPFRSDGSGLQKSLPKDVREIPVESSPVLIYEANWSDLSHPDNPPKVRDSRDVVTTFYRTVRAAWYWASQISPRENAGDTSLNPKPMLVWLMIAVLLNTILIAAWRLDWTVEALLAEIDRNGQAQMVIGSAFLLLCVYSTIQSVRKGTSNWQKAQPKHPAWILMQLPVLILWGFYRPIFFVLGAEMLFFLSLAVFTVYPVNLFGWLLAFPFRAAGHLLNRLGTPWLVRWIHRLGSVMVVLPTQSYLQAVKATGNLFSILFAEKGTPVRLNALLWFFWVFIGFVLLLLLCELLLLFPLALLLVDSDTGQGAAAVSTGVIVFAFVLTLPLYLLLLKFLLPGIDLILDVSNYHLASREEREEYFVRLDRGASELARKGCKEIHLLAHSLGSVIAFDWLAARKSELRPLVHLHTIGSPLDKFWYLDHGQAGRDRNREGLTDTAAETWTNYWAYSDPVSGKLHRYEGPTLGVNNVRIRWLGPYLLSHAWYWSNKTVLQTLRSDLATQNRTA